MTHIYLIRHAEAEGNSLPDRPGAGQQQSDRRGLLARCKLWSGGLQISRFDAVYASDLYRTCATGQRDLQTQGSGTPPQPGAAGDLRGSVGAPQLGRGLPPLAGRDGAFHQQAGSMALGRGQRTPWRPEAGCWLPSEKSQRSIRGKPVAVFSHGYVLRMLLSYLQGYSLEELGRTPTGDNTAVSLLEAEGDALRVVFRDDNSHLQLLGEKGKRPRGLEPGLWFAPLRLPEQAEVFCALASSLWQRSFDRTRLLEDGGRRETLLGYLGEEPVGVLQLDAASGWISPTGHPAGLSAPGLRRPADRAGGTADSSGGRWENLRCAAGKW